MKLKSIITGFISGCAGAAFFYYFIPAKSSTTVITQPLTHTNNHINQLVSTKQILEDDVFVNAASASTNSVVFIKSKSVNVQSNNWFDLYFNRGSSQSVSSGSGVILKENGYIVTNYHVIEGSDNIEVIHGKKSFDAEIVGYDKSTDLAVLKIKADNLPAITIGSSKKARIGEWVLAVGNPLNLQRTVTAGIISAKGRILNVVNSNFPIESFIQTDAAINPGNSGGALVNGKGELIGINTAIVSETGSYAGYGFAVPVDIVIKVVDDIIKYGDVQKVIFGADIIELNEEISRQLKTNSLEGVVLNYVEKGSTAEKSGLQKGDVILSIDGEKINTHAEFNEQVAYYRPGDKVQIEYERLGKVMKKEIVLLNREGGTKVLVRKTYASKVLGAELEVISKAEMRKLGTENGVRVVSVNGGLFKRLSIQEGFIITSINGIEIQQISELEDILSNISGRVTIRGFSENGVRGYYSYWF